VGGGEGDIGVRPDGTVADDNGDGRVGDGKSGRGRWADEVDMGGGEVVERCAGFMGGGLDSGMGKDVVGGQRTGRKTDRHIDEDDAPKADRAQPPTRRKKLKTEGEERKTGGRPQSVPRAARVYPFDYSGVTFH
jgi:hypothetical protein